MRFGERVPLIPERKIPTPFGVVVTPDFELPPLKLPQLDDRQKLAIRHGLGISGADLVELVPFVGEVAADTIRGMHEQALRGVLSPEEYTLFRKYDKQFFSVIAVARTFLEIK